MVRTCTWRSTPAGAAGSCTCRRRRRRSSASASVSRRATRRRWRRSRSSTSNCCAGGRWGDGGCRSSAATRWRRWPTWSRRRWPREASMSTSAMGSAKITREHLDRWAVVYVRQSTLAQVRDHGESALRQYALAEDAERLGWPPEQIVVIDADLGVSGRGGSARAGFKELVGRVCCGEVGAVFGLEVSRLARSSADLQRLLELCSLTDTLIVDGDGIYDLGQFNDRLLLGLKGTMSEAELHVLAGRLQGARRAAAERGELRFPLAVGYVYDDDGKIVIDPDDEVHAAIADVFAAFEQTGSAFGVVGAFADRPFPARAYGGAWAGQLRYCRLSHSRAQTVLRNPAYAGAYVFGRRASRRRVDPDGTIHTTTTMLPREQWGVVIYDHHPGYISRDQFVRNEQRLAANNKSRGARPPGGRQRTVAGHRPLRRLRTL